MKKTFILACAILSTSAMAATELGSFTLATTGVNSASATLVGTSDLELTLDSITVSPDQGNDYKYWADKAVPNINVGNNAGTWTMTFTLANTGSTALTIDSLALDVIGVTSGGQAQNAGGGVAVTEGETWVGSTDGSTNKPIDFTLALGENSYMQTVNVVSTTADPVYTLDSPIELAANGGSVTFTVMADNNAAYTGGAFVGLKGITVNGTAVVPEPATATLSLLALAGLAARRRRK